MKLYQINMYLYKVASKKDWTVYSGEGHILEQGKYSNMVDKYGDEEVLFLNMQSHNIYLHNSEAEIKSHLEFLEYVKELVKENE